MAESLTDFIHETLKEIHNAFEARIAALEAMVKGAPPVDPPSSVTVTASGDGYTKDNPPPAIVVDPPVEQPGTT